MGESKMDGNRKRSVRKARLAMLTPRTLHHCQALFITPGSGQTPRPSHGDQFRRTNGGVRVTSQA
jgi:hypothetical protein